MFRLITFIAILLIVSCEKETKWPLQGQQTHSVVVDGIITDELKTQSVKISQSFDTLNEIPSPVVGAEVIVSGNGNVYQFHEKGGSPGDYFSDSQFSGVAGQEYSLLITISNKVYSAKANMESGTDSFIFAKYERDSDSGQYHFYWVADPYTPLNPAMYELLLDWSKVPGFTAADSVSTHARLLYYSLPTLDVSEIFAPAMEKIKFPAGTLVTERRYSITSGYAAFLRAMLLETTWQGGYFTTASANVPTNLSAGAIGYFAVCAVTSQTARVNAILP